eukprot:CAMPEP_0206285988 /NCGR_PEP_ID=MMETSP0106_2-20121207/374_1 /ASSEMBLY_ACC=CAM_ASM_000206 /TAXON_ID=81532 /ORGANISM="Acanthoeca-like sp., Strain 10tr" /LENGTH=221 /DNA_ID=CAMNT_0053716507 /DNA_START=183 /DNA_END=850 /DNA_ORIENTATION=+
MSNFRMGAAPRPRCGSTSRRPCCLVVDERLVDADGAKVGARADEHHRAVRVLVSQVAHRQDSGPVAELPIPLLLSPRLPAAGQPHRQACAANGSVLLSGKDEAQRRHRRMAERQAVAAQAGGRPCTPALSCEMARTAALVSVAMSSGVPRVGSSPASNGDLSNAHSDMCARPSDSVSRCGVDPGEPSQLTQTPTSSMSASPHPEFGPVTVQSGVPSSATLA